MSNIYVTYHSVNDGVARVLEASLLFSDGSVADAQTYAVASGSKTTSIHAMKHHNTDGDVFMYSGSSKYIEDSSSGFGTLKVDWADSEKQFGFFAAYSPKDKCSENKSKNFGSNTAKKITPT